MVTCTVLAIAIKPFFAAAVEGIFDIVAVSMDTKVVGIGGTFAYI